MNIAAGEEGSAQALREPGHKQLIGVGISLITLPTWRPTINGPISTPTSKSLASGACQTVSGPFESIAKYSEDFTVATWDKNGGSCSDTANSTAGPDGNTTADTVTAVTPRPALNFAMNLITPLRCNGVQLHQ